MSPRPFVIPAKAGIQSLLPWSPETPWIPACAGRTGEPWIPACAGMTGETP